MARVMALLEMALFRWLASEASSSVGMGDLLEPMFMAEAWVWNRAAAFAKSSACIIMCVCVYVCVGVYEGYSGYIDPFC